VRKQFLYYAEKNDFIACLIIQEVMLESFAVSMYTDTGRAIGGKAGRLFLNIAEEEKEHLEHSLDILRTKLKNDPAGFISKFEEIHFSCMTILVEFTATPDLKVHCGVCNSNCMKGSLCHIGLDIVKIRGNALTLYAKSLDNIGISGEKSIVWIASLPA
jgi:fatty aldehyde decarbonylase